MKEKVLQVIKNSQKSIDAMKIMRTVKDDYSREDLEEVLSSIDELLKEGKIVSRRNNCYMPFERSKYKKGKIEITKSGNGYVLLPERDLFINKQNLKGAQNGDTVICEVTKDRKDLFEGKVKRVLTRSLGGALAEVLVDNDGNYSLKMLSDLPFKVVLESGEEVGLLDGEIVKLEVVSEVGNTIYARVKSRVGHKNSPDIDILKIVAEFDIPYEFSEETLQEAKLMPKTVLPKDFEGRRDLRDKEIFTIDGSDTKDIDDAISLEKLPNGNYLLGVHIADVSYYVKEGSALKKEALERGNSVYLADRVIPMLPIELSNGICSLNPNVDRCAMSIEMEIDKEGNVVHKDLFRSIIKSRKKMTYESVNKVLKGNCEEEYKPYEKTLLQMHELSKILKANKTRRGEIDFISSEVKLVVDENGKVIDIKKRVQDLAEELIENFMVVANESVSRTMTEHNVPSIYRVHGTPSPQKIKEFLEFANILGCNIIGKIDYNNIRPKDIQNILSQLEKSPAYEILNKHLLRCMQKAVYDTTNIGHFGIASTDYTHFTSPIRRFSDLELHYIIGETIFKKSDNTFNETLRRTLPYITEHISETERTADNCEHEVDNMKIAEYMEEHIGEEYDAVIDGMLKNGFFVETDNLISGLVKLETLEDYYTFKEDLMAYVGKKKQIAFRLGDKVRVECIGASKEQRTVDFTLVKKVKNGNNQ